MSLGTAAGAGIGIAIGNIGTFRIRIEIVVVGKSSLLTALSESGAPEKPCMDWFQLEDDFDDFEDKDEDQVMAGSGGYTGIGMAYAGPSYAAAGAMGMAMIRPRVSFSLSKNIVLVDRGLEQWAWDTNQHDLDLVFLDEIQAQLDFEKNRQLLASLILCSLAFKLHADLLSSNLDSEGVLLQCGDVEENPGPNQGITVIILMACQLLKVIASIGKTECQLKSSQTSSDLLHVHCTAAATTSNEDIICYINSELFPPVEREYKDGLITAVFPAYLPEVVNCCSVNGSVPTVSAMCRDFVDEHPTVPPPIRLTPSSGPVKSSAPASPPFQTGSPSTHIMNIPNTMTTVARARNETSEVVCTTAVITSIILGSVCGTFVTCVFVIFTVSYSCNKRDMALCRKIKMWKTNSSMQKISGKSENEMSENEMINK